jgi:hypothetical protein
VHRELSGSLSQLWVWKLDLDYEVLGREYPDQFIAGVDKANPIFKLPNTQQSLLYHHALAGFPPKETFLAAVRVIITQDGPV